MKTPVWRMAAACLTLLAAVGAARAADGIVWTKSYAQAVAQARQTKKLMLVDFYTEW